MFRGAIFSGHGVYGYICLCLLKPLMSPTLMVLVNLGARLKTSSEVSEHSEESDIRLLTHSEHDLVRS